MKITEKLKDVLSAEDLESLNKAIKDMVNEEAQKRSELLAEEKIKKVESIAEEYVNEKVEEKTKEIVENYDEKMVELETKLVKSLDSFLESEISEKISDTLLEGIAINDTLKPVVEGIKTVFATNLLEVDTEGANVVKKMQTKLEEAEKALSESIAEKMTLNETLEKIAVKNLINEKTEGLNSEQSERIKLMFEDKSFEDVDKSIEGMVDMVISEENKVNDDDDTNSLNEDDGIKVQKPKLNEVERSTIHAKAERYI